MFRIVFVLEIFFLVFAHSLNMYMTKKLSSPLNSNKPTQASPRKGCRTWISYRSEEYTSAKKPLLFESYFSNKQFQIEEDSEYGRVRSIITLTESGEIVQHTSDGPAAKNIKGSWSLHSNEVLQMIIERTFTGSYFEHSIQTHYLGKITETSSNFQVIVGDSCDEVNELDSEIPVGKFCMFRTTSNSLINANILFPLEMSYT